MGGAPHPFKRKALGTRLHLSPFPPETPDTQAILGITVDPREIEDDAYAGVLEVNSYIGNLKLEKKIVPPI